jgi:CRP/FNR family cyclic AMP-dependent transcriptional regulator
MSETKSELFDGLSREETDAVIALGSHVTVPSRAVLFNLGSPADRIFVVERGRVALTLPIQVLDQTEDILLEERVPGEAVGWSALIPPHHFTLKGVAVFETELIALPRTALLDHFAAHPAVGHMIMRNVAATVGQRLQLLQAMWMREMQRVVETRLASSGAAGR